MTSLFSTPDIAPTLIDAVGLDVPESMTGASIIPVIRDARSPWREDCFFQISETETGRAVRTKRWKYGVTADYHSDQPSAPLYCEAYLYDLDADPDEMVNLVGVAAFRGVADDLKTRLLAWIDQVEDMRPEIVDAQEPAQPLRTQHRVHFSDLREEYQTDRLMGGYAED